jgi:hypothetical protein
MPIKTYEQSNLLLNQNFIEPAGAADLLACRGDMVLVEGEITDASGRRKPPTSTMRQAVVLARGDKLVLVSGFFDDLAKLPQFIARYSADYAPEVKILFFVANIADPLLVEDRGVRYHLEPLIDGLVWNELLDVAALEKGDLKGQSSGEKVVTVLKALADVKLPKRVVSLEQALGMTIEVELPTRGAV